MFLYWGGRRGVGFGLFFDLFFFFFLFFFGGGVRVKGFGSSIRFQGSALHKSDPARLLPESSQPAAIQDVPIGP